MKRLGALAAAVAMVAGAWALRDATTDDGGGGGGSGSGSGSGAPAVLRLRCATELKAVCDGVAKNRDDVRVTIEDPGTTADALARIETDEDPGFDAWLVAGPWGAMAADDRAFAGLDGEVLGEPSRVLARSPAVIVVQSARRNEVAAACRGTIAWACVGEQAGTLRVGLTAPDRGDGLIPLAGAAADRLDTTEYSSVDFEEPGFASWLDGLSTSATVRLGDRSALAAAVGQAGTFSVVGALEAEASRLLRDREDWVTIYPDPMTTADVQLVPREGVDADEALDRLDPSRLIDALAAEGWRIDGAEPDGAVDAPELPETANLPGPGVLNALKGLW
jgi:hypothetical protein